MSIKFDLGKKDGKVNDIEADELESALNEIDKISEKYNVTFVISTAVEESMLPANYVGNVVCKL